ncbi:hypothetical protein JB92DRAFT_3113054 [Gautieria morchelliformis]|nr:hypothetical protein JB92DRAFT_3113054 [Gautieria morchelliformis]
MATKTPLGWWTPALEAKHLEEASHIANNGRISGFQWPDRYPDTEAEAREIHTSLFAAQLRPPPLPPTTNLLTIGTHASEILQHIECHRDSVELSEDDTGNESEADTGNESEDETGNANESGGISDHPGHDLNSEAIHHQVNDKLRHDLNALLPRMHSVKSLMEQTSLEESEEMAEFLTLIEDFHTFQHMRPSALRLSTQRQILCYKQSMHAVPSLASGLYIFEALSEADADADADAAKHFYVVYWPEDTTWDDDAMPSVTNNRVTFIRYLTKIADQILALVSSEHARELDLDKFAAYDNDLEEEDEDYARGDADEDRAVLEHQLFGMRAVVQDTERQLKETKAGLDVLNADVAGLREELQRMEHELQNARGVEGTLNDDLGTTKEEIWIGTYSAGDEAREQPVRSNPVNLKEEDDRAPQSGSTSHDSVLELHAPSFSTAALTEDPRHVNNVGGRAGYVDIHPLIAEAYMYFWTDGSTSQAPQETVGAVQTTDPYAATFTDNAAIQCPMMFVNGGAVDTVVSGEVSGEGSDEIYGAFADFFYLDAASYPVSIHNATLSTVAFSPSIP